MVAQRIETIILYTALSVWIITGLSTLVTDCGGLRSLVQGLNVLEIRSKVMLCTMKLSLEFNTLIKWSKKKCQIDNPIQITRNSALFASSGNT